MLKRILLLAVVVTTTVIGALANWVQTDKMCYEIRNDGTAYVSYRYYGDNSTQRNYYTGTVEIPESFEYESKTYKVTGIAQIKQASAKLGKMFEELYFRS